jgi:hypothetical protein
MLGAELGREEMKGGVRHLAYQSLQVYQTQALAYVVAQHDNVRSQEPPVLWAGGVMKLKPVFGPASADLEDERLVHVPKQGH